MDETKLNESDLDNAMQKISETSQDSSKLDEQETRDRIQRWHMLSRKLGEKYAGCRVNNYDITAEGESRKLQEQAIEKVRIYCLNMTEYLTMGRNVILYGPPGTGKDHLLSALLRVAVLNGGATADWWNGMDLFGYVRDMMDTNEKEATIIRDLVLPDVLAISDPVPPAGDLQAYRTEFLLRVIDKRYRQRKATWVTANWEHGAEADKKTAPQIVDRLRDGAMAIYCNWPSYRKAE